MLLPVKLLRDQPLQQQLYEQLHEMIVSRRLPAGLRMPSTRMLADQFSVSRITVLLTYERLIADGLLRTEPAKGTFVNPVAAEPRRPAQAAPAAVAGADAEVGRPDPRLFPTGRWRSLIRAALDSLGASLSRDLADGDPALCWSIARWLGTSRGLAADADQIVLANDRRHALRTAADLLLRPGVAAVTEQPNDPHTLHLLASTGATIVPVPVDGEGLMTERLPGRPVAAALVTPRHQQPTGAVMTAARRRALLAWAARSGAIIIEEDFDSDLQYGPEQAPMLMSMDRDDRVLHIGGFGAALGPATLRGYLLVPRPLIAPARAASRLAGQYTGLLEGSALSALLDSGAYGLHVRTLRKIYLARRDAMVAAIRREFGEAGRIVPAAAGLRMAWTLPADCWTAETVAELARRRGLDASALADDTVLLGFGTPAEREIESAVARLAADLAAVPVRYSQSAD